MIQAQEGTKDHYEEEAWSYMHWIMKWLNWKSQIITWFASIFDPTGGTSQKRMFLQPPRSTPPTSPPWTKHSVGPLSFWSTWLRSLALRLSWPNCGNGGGACHLAFQGLDVPSWCPPYFKSFDRQTSTSKHSVICCLTLHFFMALLGIHSTVFVPCLGGYESRKCSTCFRQEACWQVLHQQAQITRSPRVELRDWQRLSRCA